MPPEEFPQKLDDFFISTLKYGLSWVLNYLNGWSQLCN